jgi:predicted transcriptional regulator
MNEEIEFSKQVLESLLSLLGHLDAGGIIEVTVLPRNGGGPKAVGYFDNIQHAASEIVRFDGRDNIFVSLNPVKRHLLARAENQMATCKNRITDSDMLCDSWFFIDIDPERESGTSSTDDELDAALFVQKQVCDWFIEQGVPKESMMTAVSGNGAYVLIRLPAYSITPESIETKKNLLKYLSDMFSTEAVKIDEKVYNPSRLMAAIGTMKCKGVETPQRQHRRSSIHRVAGETFKLGQDYQVVPFDLYSLAEMLLPQESKQKAVMRSQENGQNWFDIRKYAPSLEGYHETQRGWAYAKCPAHNGKGNTSLHINLTTGAYGCHKGCTTNQIREALGISKSVGFLSGSPDKQEFPIVPLTWPTPPAEAALYGLAGDIVRTIEPRSEADVAALLIQFLVAFGNVVGRSAHFMAEADEHYMNLFAVLVGPSSKGRKGTSWSQIQRLFVAVDGDWNDRILNGLSSGEGLIWAVRDPIFKQEPIKEKGRIVEYQEVKTDSGVEDKRLLAIEPEFASILRAMGREGNTLSALIRQAWDKGSLRVMTKNSPAQATDAHVSIVGHITRDELRRFLDSTEAGNGFANRFLWVCVKRSKCLPEGGSLHQVDFAPTVRLLSEAVEFARGVSEMKRDEKARALWYEVYPKLSEGMPGLLGSVTSRGEAQVMRLACIYALLDKSAIVRRVHLEAALALWRYCEDSARFIFGDSLGDPVADDVLHNLRGAENGMTRTEISNLFGRNRRTQEIGRALSSLAEAGLVHRVVEESDGPGRPSERWFATRTTSQKLTGSNETNEKNERMNDYENSSFNSSFSFYDPSEAEPTDAVEGFIM